MKLGKPSFAWPVLHPHIHIIEPSPSPVKRDPGLKRRPGLSLPGVRPMTAEAASPEIRWHAAGRRGRIVVKVI